MKLDSYAFTNSGGRSYNQDAVGSKEEAERAVFVVADGLGGHRDGEQASACVVQTLLEAMPAEEDDLAQWLETAIAQANQNILNIQAEKHSNMKSTAAAAVVRREEAAFANVGDSRVYYLHNKAIAKVTEDHSVAYKKYKAGEIARWQIGSDEDQSCLLRALGNPERNQPQCTALDAPLVPGDGFLLCSDGFWEYVFDEEILIDFLKAESAQDWAELMLLRAMERIQPGNDNLSVLTVMVNP